MGQGTCPRVPFAVHRIIISEIHLGYVIYGKSHKHRGTAQLINKEDWIKVKGEHEPVKMQEEHDQIMARIAQNAIIPRKCRVGALPLSGLLYCSKCGRRMQFKRRETKNGGYWTAICSYRYPDGTKCDQVGRKLDDEFYNALYQKITKFDGQTLELVDEINEQYQELQALCEMKQKELVQTEQAIDNLFELYEDGKMPKQRLSDRIAGHEKTKTELESEIEKCKTALASQVNLVTVEMVKKRIEEFKNLWLNAIDPSEQNRAFKILIDRIVYDREDDSLRLDVLYK